MLLLLHLAATLYMTGLIWFVQVVHYPLLERVSRESEDFTNYERAHVRRTGWVVMPAMLLELGTAIALLIPAFAGNRPPYFILSLVVLAGIWLVTFSLSVPCHNKLSKGWDPSAHRRLVSTNWLRTLGWSARALYLLWLMVPLIVS